MRLRIGIVCTPAVTQAGTPVGTQAWMSVELGLELAGRAPDVPDAAEQSLDLRQLHLKTIPWSDQPIDFRYQLDVHARHPDGHLNA